MNVSDCATPGKFPILLTNILVGILIPKSPELNREQREFLRGWDLSRPYVAAAFDAASRGPGNSRNTPIEQGLRFCCRALTGQVVAHLQGPINLPIRTDETDSTADDRALT